MSENSNSEARGAALAGLVQKIVDRLFTNGAGQRARRLVLTVDSPTGRDLGGWSEAGAASQIEAALLAAGAVPQHAPTELREALAAYAHEAWSGWMQYLFSKCSPLHEGPLRIPDEWAARWKQQIDTPYAALSEAEKES